MHDTPSLVHRPLIRDDIDSLLALINAAEQQSSVPVVTTRSDVANKFDEPHQDLSTDTVGVIDSDGSLIAYIWTSMRPNPTREQVAHISGRVHPDWTRRGIGGSLIEWGVGRARTRLAEQSDELPKAIRAYVYEEEVATVYAYESQGFEVERYFLELTRDLSSTEATPASEMLPSEISVTSWSQELDEAVRIVHNSAFRDHWGSEPLSESRWRRWLSQNEHFLPEASFVALAGEEVVGYTMNAAYPQEWDELGYSEGWINGLGTVRGWRKRGIASALIKASIQAFSDLGYDRASLGVDTASPTGALGLYTGHGFTQTRREVSYSIPVSRSGD